MGGAQELAPQINEAANPAEINPLSLLCSDLSEQLAANTLA